MLHPKRLALLAVITILIACGASSREKILRASFTTVEGARVEFVEFDTRKQAEIVGSATSKAQGKEALTKYRQDREKYVQAFVRVYRALTIAVLTSGSPSLQTAMLAVTEIVEDVRMLTGHK